MDPVSQNHLYQRIINQIDYEARLLEAKKRFWFFSFFLIVSLIFLMPLLANVVASARAMGLGAITSLIISDFNIIIANFKEFSLSLLEALPIIPLAFAVVPLIFFLYSLAQMTSSLIEFLKFKQN